MWRRSAGPPAHRRGAARGYRHKFKLPQKRSQPRTLLRRWLEERRDLGPHQDNLMDVLKRGETSSEHFSGPQLLFQERLG